MAAFQRENGHWSAAIVGNQVFVDSSDLTHDVCLEVIGEFTDVYDKHAYGCAIAKVLNDNMPLKPVT